MVTQAICAARMLGQFAISDGVLCSQDKRDEHMTWSHFDHEADMGLHGEGATLAQAFSEVATALTAVITDVALVKPDTCVDIQCYSSDNELLLVDWLNALVYEMATRRMLFSKFDVRIEDDRLNARAWGEAVDRVRHQPAVEVKGATMTALSVKQDDRGRWLAECVVDV